MNNLFYYLDGANKRGPFSKEEIINLHLPESTWIYGDAMDKWKLISEVKELHINPLQSVEHKQENINQSSSEIVQDLLTDNSSASQKNMLHKMPIKASKLISKLVCCLAFIALCLYNIIIASKFVGLLSISFERGEIYEYELPAVWGLAILLGTTIIAFAIFTKSILSNSKESNK